jgi:hypothetical protein
MAVSAELDMALVSAVEIKLADRGLLWLLCVTVE